ncbi:calcium/proton exchanger [Thalassoroseus pseudoceratinae]|uniref:calcium/proton exchanger n=1 Tax=Thalassoroseus pseudoceratinae TaxID=2713176 RepID=UPI001420217B|nr:calcium/proton exchanger [Thalassoroseus pseudoceratinae]
MDWLKRVGWLNVMLVFVPVALVLHWVGGSGTWVFVTAALGIIPLAGLMGKSTEMLAERFGPGIGGLMNASFGNAAELIIAVIALRAGKIEVVRASLTGSILGNILLVLGASLFAGGLKYNRQKFNATAAGMSATLLVLAAIGLIVPAVFHGILVGQGAEHLDALERDLSLEIAIVLFVVYGLNLVFSLKTHKHLYSAGAHSPSEASSDHPTEEDSANPAIPHEADEHWSQSVAVTVLLVSTLAVAIVSEAMIGAIEDAREAFGWTKLFVGVIVIAIVGNAAEHSSAILMAMKNRMDLAVQIAIGSSLQIALFVAPVLVLVSYLPGFPALNLIFAPLEVVAVTLSVLVVALVAFDGRSNWFEGLLLLAVYVILGIAFFNLPESEEHHSAPTHTEESANTDSSGNLATQNVGLVSNFDWAVCGSGVDGSESVRTKLT